jgi:hypothetical protein
MPHRDKGCEHDKGLVCDSRSERVIVGFVVDTVKMLAELRQERAQLEEAILVLERLAGGQGRRRGRLPAWMSAQRLGPTVVAPDRKRKPFSAATRKKMAESQRKRWVAKKAE